MPPRPRKIPKVTPKAKAKAKAAPKKQLPVLVQKDAPKPPPPDGGDTGKLPESVLNMKFMLGAMMAAAASINDLATVIAQGVRDDNAGKRGGIAAGFERAAAYARLQPFEIKVAEGFDKKEPKE